MTVVFVHIYPNVHVAWFYDLWSEVRKRSKAFNNFLKTNRAPSLWRQSDLLFALTLHLLLV